jgi:phospholipid transport system substrate-binding protein
MSMSISSVPRALVTGAAAAMVLFGVVMLAGPLESSAQAKSSKSDEDKAVTFMRTTANALIDAQRRGTPEAFQRVVNRYGHVPAIGLYALGNYRKGLQRRARSSYYKGLSKFVGRYAASESPKYPVVRATFAPAAIRDGRNILVDSQVHLKGGTYYNVRWMLVSQRGTFKVRDAQVLGFWVSPFLQKLYEDFLRRHNGRVDALVMVLNQ